MKKAPRELMPFTDDPPEVKEKINWLNAQGRGSFAEREAIIRTMRYQFWAKNKQSMTGAS